MISFSASVAFDRDVWWRSGLSRQVSRLACTAQARVSHHHPRKHHGRWCHRSTSSCHVMVLLLFGLQLLHMSRLSHRKQVVVCQGVLQINTNTLEVSTLGGPWQGTDKWEGGVVANDGAMYCMPQRSKIVLKIAPKNNGLGVSRQRGRSVGGRGLGWARHAHFCVTSLGQWLGCLFCIALPCSCLRGCAVLPLLRSTAKAFASGNEV